MSNSASQKKKEVKPPITKQLAGFDTIKVKLAKMGADWAEVDPNVYLARNRIKEQLFGDEFYERYGDQIDIKIFMSNVQPNQTLARLGHFFTGNFPFGNCHAGLQIGQKTLNWYDNSLVSIGDFGSSTGFILFSPNENLIVKLTKELMEKITDFVIEWNVKAEYNRYFKNCHVFVEEFLSIVGLSFPNGPLGKFVKSIRDGNTDRRIETKNCGILVFKDHDELDQLEHKYSENLTEEEKKILKLFHRGFQLQERSQEVLPRRNFVCPAGEDPTGLEGALRKQKEEENI